MGRNLSRNWEVDIGGRIIFPKKLGDFGTGVEGSVETTDGRSVYKVGNQVLTFDEVEMDIAITDDKREYKICEEFWKSGIAQDVFVRARDATGNVDQSFLFAGCQLVPDKMNGFDPKSKDQDMKKYKLLPKSIEEIT